MPHRPSVLFVCVHNAGRSQMAAGYLRTRCRAAGWRSARPAPCPPTGINPVAVEAMAEEGIDIAAARPALLTPDAVPRLRRRHHHGLRRRLPDLPRQALRGLGARGPGRPGPRHRPARSATTSAAASSASSPSWCPRPSATPGRPPADRAERAPDRPPARRPRLLWARGRGEPLPCPARRTSRPDPDVDVLVVGAGPTGLALAAELAATGTRVRLVDRQHDRVHESRALGVQPRTVEVLARLGLAEAAGGRGQPRRAAGAARRRAGHPHPAVRPRPDRHRLPLPAVPLPGRDRADPHARTSPPGASRSSAASS